MSDNNKDREDEGEKYYAGGTNSGMMVQGRPDGDKKKTDAEANKLVEDILALAAKGGAAPPSSSSSSSSQDQPQRSVFEGRGNRLGDEQSPASTAATPVEGVVLNRGQAEAPAPLVERRLVFYRNGFVIDNRPDVLHSYDGFLKIE
jgi:hypothetical protein